MIEIHHRSDGRHQSSSRYHDLADLATFARTAVIDAHALTCALRSEADRRGLQLPDRLTVPDHLGSGLCAGGPRQPQPRRP